MLEVRAGSQAVPDRMPHRWEGVYAFIEFD
jgi:hypothetical protein